jgi:hypothetical protein
MSIHTWGVVGNDFFIFVSKFVVVGQIFITDGLQNKRQIPCIINAEKKFEIRMGLMEVEELRIERVVDEKWVGVGRFLSCILFYLFICGSDDCRICCIGNSDEISFFEVVWCFFVQVISKIMLYHTSCDSNFFGGRDVFKFSGDFVFSFLADGTGIKDDNISIFFCLTIGKSAIEENRFNPG